MEAKKYLEKIKINFPDITWQKYRLITQGWNHAVIVLDGQIIFRFPKEQAYISDFQNEIKLLHYLKPQLSVGIPDYQYISEDATFAGYKLLQGNRLSASFFHKLSVKDKNAIAAQLAGFLTSLHATPKNIVDECKIRIDDRKETFHCLMDNCRQMLYPRLLPKETLLIENYLQELEEAINCTTTNALLHNDLIWEHLLWNKACMKLNVIDFSDRIYGDPAIDFYGLLEFGDEFANKVFKLYAGNKDSQFMHRAKLYYQRIALWVMIDSLQDAHSSFSEGYQMFQERVFYNCSK